MCSVLLRRATAGCTGSLEAIHYLRSQPSLCLSKRRLPFRRHNRSSCSLDRERQSYSHSADPQRGCCHNLPRSGSNCRYYYGYTLSPWGNMRDKEPMFVRSRFQYRSMIRYGVKRNHMGIPNQTFCVVIAKRMWRYRP